MPTIQAIKEDRVKKRKPVIDYTDDDGKPVVDYTDDNGEPGRVE